MNIVEHQYGYITTRINSAQFTHHLRGQKYKYQENNDSSRNDYKIYIIK